MVWTAEGEVRRAHELVDRELAAGELCPLDALCAVALSELSALSASVCVQTGLGPVIAAGSTRGVAGSLVDLEVVCGQGPVSDAAALSQPVVVEDPAAESAHDWHGFLPQLPNMGVGVIWALPVQLDGNPPVVLELSFAPVSSPTQRGHLTGGHLATVAGHLIAQDAAARGPAACLADLEALLSQRAVIYQAQGMYMVRFNTDAAGALARMRAIAVVLGARLQDVAQAIVDRDQLPGRP